MSKKYKRKHKRFGKFKSVLEKLVSERLPKGWVYEGERLTYLLPKKYIPDFIITKHNGQKIYIEVKGYLRYEDQQKMRAVKFSNPDIDIRFFFPMDKRVHMSKMLNSEWCIKYGFPYAIGRFPRNWFR